LYAVKQVVAATGPAHWVFIGHCFDGHRFEVEGLNVWEHSWEGTGLVADVKDPLYDQNFTFPVYIMEASGKKVEFAAGEFSNTVWGFFQTEH
jgi:hypothetical protein